MEVIHQPGDKVVNNQLLVLMHLSQLLNYITGFGGLIVPLIIWVTNKDRVHDMDKQGKEVVNFQISTMIYALIAIPCILLFGLGILMLIAIGILAFIFPIIGAIKASNNEHFEYPFTIRIIK
ncbi:MAG: DUF4870 domain-containing protein [Gilvibacter sp.]